MKPIQTFFLVYIYLQRRTKISGLTCRTSPCSTRHLVDSETFSTQALSKTVALVNESFYFNFRLIFEIVWVQTDLKQPFFTPHTAVIWQSYIFLDNTLISAQLFAISNEDQPIPSNLVIQYYSSESKSPFAPIFYAVTFVP